MLARVANARASLADRPGQSAISYHVVNPLEHSHLDAPISRRKLFWDSMKLRVWFCLLIISSISLATSLGGKGSTSTDDADDCTSAVLQLPEPPVVTGSAIPLVVRVLISCSLTASMRLDPLSS